MVNQFLVEIDGMTTGTQKVFIIAATNRIESIDSAIKSRLSEMLDCQVLMREKNYFIKNC